jgi:hypothetical protein
MNVQKDNDTGDFWANVLEQDETLLWAGRPKPRPHWRNRQLYGPAPIAACGLLAAAWLILSTYGAEGDMWLLILPALLIIIPARATQRQLRTYARTRYALTNKRVLFFEVKDGQTRVKEHPRSAMIAPKLRPTVPPSVSFLRYGTEKPSEIGFEYIEAEQTLLPHLEQRA